jgi:hypothetical protein
LLACLHSITFLPSIINIISLLFSATLQRLWWYGVWTTGWLLAGISLVEFDACCTDGEESRLQQTLEYSVKPGKHSTTTLSLVQNRAWDSKKTCRKVQQPSNSEMHHFLCRTEFHPSFLFPERLHSCYIYFHCSRMYNYYNYLDPCALNAEFQHLIPKSLIKLPYFADLTQTGDRGWKEAQRQGEDRMTLRKTLLDPIIYLL